MISTRIGLNIRTQFTFLKISLDIFTQHLTMNIIKILLNESYPKPVNKNFMLITAIPTKTHPQTI